MKIEFYHRQLKVLAKIIFNYYNNEYEENLSINYFLKLTIRERPYPEMKMIFYVLAKKTFKEKFTITQILGFINRDHSIYSHYIKTFNSWYETDVNFKRTFDNIEKLIKKFQV